jgi:hypothetical protein
VSHPEAERVSDRSRDAGLADATLDALVVASIHDRLRMLETGTKKTQDHWYNSKVFSDVLAGVILAGFGYFLTVRFQQSAKERELNTANATEMQGLLVKISTASAPEAEAAAVSLTTFGRYSIPPLIASLQYGPERSLAAERGLTTLALTNAPDVCANLERVLDNRTQRYTAQSHTAVIRIIGTVECRTAIPAMKRYEDILNRAHADTAGLKAYQRVVRDATPSNVTQAKEELANAFRLLNAH